MTGKNIKDELINPSQDELVELMKQRVEFTRHPKDGEHGAVLNRLYKKNGSWHYRMGEGKRDLDLSQSKHYNLVQVLEQTLYGYANIMRQNDNQR